MSIINIQNMNCKKFLLPLFIGLSFYSFGQENGSDKWEKAIQNFEAIDKENPPPKDAILFTGSSSVALWKDISSYFADFVILNRGFGGSQFSDLLRYDDRVIYPYKPSKIFIYEGDNDIAGGKSPKEIMKEVKMLRARIEKKLPGTPVVFIAAKPSIARKHLKKEYEKLNKKLEKYADKTENTLFADVYSAMIDENGEVYDHIFLEDNLHMNADGYKIWQSVLAPYLDPNKTD